MRPAPTVLIALLALPGLAGCYLSHADGDADLDAPADVRDDAGDDAPADVRDDAGDGSSDVPPDVLPDGGPTCEPAMDGTWVEFRVDDNPAEANERSVPCRVVSADTDPSGELRIALECGTGGLITPHEVGIRSNPPVGFHHVGAEVEFTHVADPVWWIDRWFALRWPGGGGLVLAGVDAQRPTPWGEETSFYAPMTLEVVRGLCAPQEATCGRVERVGLDLGYYGDRRRIFDGNNGWVGLMMSVQAVVGTAEEYVEMICEDHPGSWYRALFSTIPEG